MQTRLTRTIAFLVLCTASATLLSAEEKPGEESQGTGLAFLCLKDAKLAEQDALRKALAEWLKPETPDELEVTIDKEKGQFSVTLGKQFVVGQLVPKPLPKEDIEYACGNALFWPEAKDILKGHKAHVIVFAAGEYEGRMQRPLLLTRVIAGCSEVFPTSAIYWGDAAVVHKPDFFRKAAPPSGVDNDAPGLLWVGYLRERHEDGSFSLYTRGLSSYGCMDLEVVRTRRKPSDVLESVHDLAVYLIENGNVIRDGDTIGPDAETKIKTRYAESVIGREEKVIRVEF